MAAKDVSTVFSLYSISFKPTESQEPSALVRPQSVVTADSSWHSVQRAQSGKGALAAVVGGWRDDILRGYDLLLCPSPTRSLFGCMLHTQLRFDSTVRSDRNRYFATMIYYLLWKHWTHFSGGITFLSFLNNDCVSSKSYGSDGKLAFCLIHVVYRLGLSTL